MSRFARAVLSLFGAAAIAWAVIALLARDRSLEKPMQSGVLRVAYAVEPPYAYVGADGQVTGESPELARSVIAGLGIPNVRFIQTEFGSLLPGLQADRYDVVASGMFITPERARVVSFSIPTFRVRQGLLVPKGNPRGLHSYRAAVASPQVRVAVLSGSVEEALLGRLGLPRSRCLAAPDSATARRAVVAGEADALAVSAPTVRWMARPGETEVANPFEEAPRDRTGFGGFVFRKADVRLREAWNTRLRALVGSRAHLALIARFGFTEADLPGPMSTESLVEEP